MRNFTNNKSQLFENKIVEVWNSGDAESKTNYVDGQRQGEDIEYYESGAVKGKANYVYDKLQGEVISYTVNGKIEKIEYYKDDVLINNKK